MSAYSYSITFGDVYETNNPIDKSELLHNGVKELGSVSTKLTDETREKLTKQFDENQKDKERLKKESTITF